MAETSSDWARPASDVSMSSDEDDFVSSQSTPSIEPEALAKQRLLSSPFRKLNLEANSSESSDQGVARTRTSILGTTESMLSNCNVSPSEMTDEEVVESPKKPLQLLELPIDVLKDIIKEVTHTNDLTSLALTCSVMHSLTIPHMYSRFDIVWPESLHPANEDYSGVDALSYGLSTLVMGEDVFRRGERSRSPSWPLQRHGNHYAQFTRTFSIGNGPLSWVQEYSVNREVGKMLGTLVALAVARMINLEAFIWDMPTGVVREIWLALASLADQPDNNCRLDRVWVRWHDNSDNILRVPAGSAAASTLEGRLLQKYKHVEHPSLSVLPPLRSIAVLDIDEPAYVEELAVLIERSRHRLVELRIGITSKAHRADWVRCAEQTGNPEDSTSSWPKIGGLLSILSKRGLQPEVDDSVTPSLTTTGSLTSEGSTVKDAKSDNPINHHNSSAVPDSAPQNIKVVEVTNSKSLPLNASHPARSNASVPLNLEVLELERVPLSIPHLLPTIDWTRLTTLTLMGCEEHENLWRTLRRKYAPPQLPPKRAQAGERRRSSLSAQDFPLNIQHLRTDTVTPYLMLFIKDTLAPNTLESVYLHQTPDAESNVNIEAIYRHIIRKHRLSLRKILVDASDRLVDTQLNNPRWQRWMFNHDMVSFVTSGRMPQLRELGMALHYRDWHFFLQRLPKMTQLRALYLPYIGKFVHRDLKELAMQVLDIVSIRPELKITYIGLLTKCYQILERTGAGNDLEMDGPPSVNSSTHPGDDGLSAFEDDEPVDISDDEHDLPRVSHSQTSLLGYSDDSEDLESEPDEPGASNVHFRLQEILFYDDKISIFKVRHGVI
ncbi:hypothetical protein N7478_002371 [Penicillium angulare]|uniref:uncharacterized protein n=1 Tax=Penicillium angulare TaxID=116970 RepID=UPI002540C6D4|nr:uncharacterized protein N7478_002371 [Penicillium angulare]KAJ5286685.1 hypothetical protein N7478_002371 [Penicillium angulare]